MLFNLDLLDQEELQELFIKSSGEFLDALPQPLPKLLQEKHADLEAIHAGMIRMKNNREKKHGDQRPQS